MSPPPAIKSAALLTDGVLLREFTGSASARAFAALVTRYGGLVHGTARRILEDDELARDVTQEVFLSFARAARRVRPDAVGAWLHTAARRTALNEKRGDSRRRRRELASMNELKHEHPAESLPAHWAEALEHLDDAMDRLSETERQCVIERFHHEKPLREIADRAGKSEDAARMTIQRALEKMFAFLRRRGVSVSAAALASGLTSELGRAASGLTPSAAAALGVRAVSIMKSSGTGTVIGLLTTALMTKPIPLAATAALAFLLAAGGGYLANSKDADKSTPASPQTTIATPATRMSGSTAPPGPVAAAATGNPEIERLLDRIESLRIKREELLRQSKRKPTGPADPKRIKETFSEMEAVQQELSNVLTRVDAAGLEDAAEAAQLRRGDSEGFILVIIFERWGALDSEAARAAAKAMTETPGTDLMAAVARGWAMRDPRAALAVADTWSDGDRQARDNFIRHVFEGWMHTDAAGAVRSLASLPAHDQITGAGCFHNLIRFPSQFAAATKEIAQMEDEVLRGKVVYEAGETWARYNGPAAAAWYDALPWKNPGAGLAAAAEIAGEWIESGNDPAAAMDWVWPKLPEEARSSCLATNVAVRWASYDRPAAEAWLTKMGISTSSVPDWNRFNP